MDLRKHPRVNMSGMEIDISDLGGFSSGTIKDVSRFGVCITDIPRRLRTKDNSITLMITGNGRRIKLQAIPKWEEESGLTMTAGVNIESVPREWVELVKKLEPQDDDIWAHEVVL